MNNNVLLDTSSLQIAVHSGNHPHPRAKQYSGKRLKSFLSILNNINSQISYSKFGNPITADDLDDKRLLIITTRMPKYNLRNPQELSVISRFYIKGGGILLMANHPFRNFKYSMPDDDIASLLGVRLIDTFVDNRNASLNIGSSSLANHKITNDLQSEIIFNTSCLLDPNDQYPIAFIPNQNPPNAFAVISKSNSDYGRFVVLADSGFIANDSTDYPGPGQISKGSNKQFIHNVLQWLLDEKSI